MRDTYSGAEKTDWIELYNSNSVTVDLSGFGLSDELSRGRKWQFPQGTVIAPGEYKVILCDGDLSKNTPSQPHTSYKIGRLREEVITLTDPTGRVLDKMIRWTGCGWAASWRTIWDLEKPYR